MVRKPTPEQQYLIDEAKKATKIGFIRYHYIERMHYEMGVSRRTAAKYFRKYASLTK